jgi:hypothetical protein
MPMEFPLVPRSLLTWDQFGLRLDLDLLEGWLNHEILREVEAIRELRLAGSGDLLELRVKVAWEGLPAWLAVRLTELRLYKGFLGCRLEAVHGPLSLPVPITLVARLVKRFAARYLRLGVEDRMLLVDLRRWLPAWLHLRVQDARCEGRFLALEVSPGGVGASFTRATEIAEA